MSNMSYCRFQNTLGDLEDCQEALNRLYQGTEALSDRELSAAKALLVKCFDIIDELAEQLEWDMDDAGAFTAVLGTIEDGLDNANAAAEENS